MGRQRHHREHARGRAKGIAGRAKKSGRERARITGVPRALQGEQKKRRGKGTAGRTRKMGVPRALQGEQEKWASQGHCRESKKHRHAPGRAQDTK
eukprot:1141934-Pelagomonas_calceolata.AAC.4